MPPRPLKKLTLGGMILLIGAATNLAVAIEPPNKPLTPPPSGECRALLEPIPEFPKRWGIRAEFITTLIQARPDLQNYFAERARLAHFIEDPDNADFFEQLGLSYNLSFDQRARQTVNSFLDARTTGLFGGLTATWRSRDDMPLRTWQIVNWLNASDDPEVNASEQRLGGDLELLATYLDDLDFKTVAIPGNFADLDGFEVLRQKLNLYLKKVDKIPTLKEFAEHSQSAQGWLAKMIITRGQPNHPEKEWVFPFRDLIAQKFLDPDAPVPAHLAVYYERLRNLMDPKAQPHHFALPGKVSGFQKVRLFKQLAFEFVFTQTIKSRFAFIKSLQTGTTHLEFLSRQEMELALLSPYFMFHYFWRSMHKIDVVIDRGLGPFLDRLFIEMFLGLKVLEGPEVRAMLRRNIKDDFQHLWQEHLAREASAPRSTPAAARPAVIPPPPETSPASSLTRQERKDAYERRQQELRKLQAAIAGRQKEPTSAPAFNGALAVSSQEEPDEDNLLFDQLIDRTLPLDVARDQLARRLVPGQILTLRIRGTRFRYRFSFAKAVLADFLDPRAGHPADFREWLEALAKGPARFYGQQGLKKLVTGPLNWEIKVLDKPIRIKGYRDRERVWRFETIGPK